ncbi:hypothetical protein [Paracoccus simplex]|uniref:hypothetical protein n=1 Tax=Paracoccus simplex TaxID=2086346 RepID=UPI00366A6D98
MAGFFWRYLSVTRPDHEPVSGSFHNFQRHTRRGIDVHDPPHLCKQAFNKAEVAPG